MVEKNQKYSHKDFTGKSLKHLPAEEFNNTRIVGSCFYQEWKEGDSSVEKDIFPTGIKGVIFEGCNLDNVYIPPSNEAIECSTKKIKVQNDLSDWIMDKEGNPVEPTDKKQRLLAGLSIDPVDIPKKKWTSEERMAFEEELYGN